MKIGNTETKLLFENDMALPIIHLDNLQTSLINKSSEKLLHERSTQVKVIACLHAIKNYSENIF